MVNMVRRDPVGAKGKRASLDAPENMVRKVKRVVRAVVGAKGKRAILDAPENTGGKEVRDPKESVDPMGSADPLEKRGNTASMVKTASVDHEVREVPVAIMENAENVDRRGAPALVPALVLAPVLVPAPVPAPVPVPARVLARVSTSELVAPNRVLVPQPLHLSNQRLYKERSLINHRYHSTTNNIVTYPNVDSLAYVIYKNPSGSA